MALTIGDRVLETTSTQGTGTINLNGPSAGFRSFVAGIGNGKKTIYLISDNANWEIGIGTVTDANPDTLSRTTILKSSNSNGAVSWGPGTRNVYCVMAADVLASTDENLNLVNFFGSGGGTANAHTATLDKAPLAYSDGMMIVYRPTIANTAAAVTLNVNGLGAKDLKINGGNPAIGQLAIGSTVVAIYKASNNTFEIVNILSGAYLPLSGGNMSGAVNEKITTVASSATPDIWTGTGNVIDYTGTVTATGFAAAPQAGARRTLICAAASTFTNGANMIINGGANFTAAPGDMINVIAVTTTQFKLEPVKVNGTALVVNPGLVNVIELAASGTTIDFTGIPAGTKRITISLSGISTNGTSNPLIQIGDSGGIENTGYGGSGSGGAAANYTTGFGFNFANGANILHGVIILTRLSESGFVWAAGGWLGASNTPLIGVTGGSKQLSAMLDRLRITTVNGTDAYDAGFINIMYE